MLLGLRVTRAWLLSVTAGLLGCLALLVISVDEPAWVIVARTIGVVAVAAFAVAAFRMPPRTRAVWWLLWGYAALTVAADVVYDVQSRLLDEAPFPGPADPLYLGAYVTAILALLILVRRIVPGHDRDAWIDTTIVTVAAAAVIGYVVARPTVVDSDESPLALVIVLAYPFLDIVILAGLTRLIIGGARTTTAMTLLIVAFLVTLSGDLLYNVVVANGSEDSVPAGLDALFLAAIVLLCGAAWTQDAQDLDAPTTRAPTPATSARLVGLALGVLTIPTLLVFVAGTNDSLRWLSLGSIGVILLVVWRLERVLSTVRAQYAQLDREARTDALTGLPNRRTLDHEIERLVDAADLRDEPLTVAMLDLDHFKAYNDRHGHQAGDRLLAGCAQAWREALPQNAFLGRYGGEEFAVLLPGIEPRVVPGMLEHLRLAMPSGRTVSIGYAAHLAGESGASTVRRADMALYRAKEQGRDCVVAAQ